MKAMQYERTGVMKIRTKSTKKLEKRAFEKLSTFSILIGVSKELWSRYSNEILITLLFGSWGIYIWVKLG